MEKKQKPKDSTRENENRESLFLEELMKIMHEKKLTELSYTAKDFSLTLKGTYRPGGDKTKPRSVKSPASAPEVREIPEDDSIREVLSENIGLFFYKTAELPSKIGVGKKIETGDYVGYIITLGVKNTVKSNYSGVITEICVENGEPVDYGKPLIRIREQQIRRD